MENFEIHLASIFKHKPFNHFLSISKILKFNHKALNDLLPSTNPADSGPSSPSPPFPLIHTSDIKQLLTLFYSYIIHKPNLDLQFFNQLNPLLCSLCTNIPNLQISKQNQIIKLQIQISTLQSLMKLKLEQVQPMTLTSDFISAFPDPFRTFYTLCKNNLRINNKKLLICLKEFKRNKKLWKGLNEIDYKIFIKLLLCEQVCIEAKRVIDGILTNAPGSIRQDSVESINLVNRVQRIDLGQVFYEGIEGNCYKYKQDVVLSINGRSFEAVLIKEICLEIADKNKVKDKAEIISKINYLAGGNVAKVFAYYNFLSYYRSIVRVEEKEDDLENFRFEEKFKNSDEFVNQFKDLAFFMKNLDASDLLPGKLGIENFGFCKGLIKLKNLDDCVNTTLKGNDRLLDTIEAFFVYLSFNLFRECLDVGGDFKDFGNFENFWGMMSKQEKKDFCDIRKNGIAMKILD